MENKEEPKTPKTTKLTEEEKQEKARMLDTERQKEFVAKYNELVEEYGFQIQPRITLDVIKRQ